MPVAHLAGDTANVAMLDTTLAADALQAAAENLELFGDLHPIRLDD